jgi:hypothetical protein
MTGASCHRRITGEDEHSLRRARVAPARASTGLRWLGMTVLHSPAGDSQTRTDTSGVRADISRGVGGMV